MAETIFDLAASAAFSPGRHPAPQTAEEAFEGLRQAWSHWVITDRAIANDPEVNYGLALIVWLEKANQRFRALAKRRFDDAAEKARHAGYSGSMNDDGAAIDQAEAQAFMSGLNMTLPENWQETWEQMRREGDPEYATYLRLKTKFEGGGP